MNVISIIYKKIDLVFTKIFQFIVWFLWDFTNIRFLLSKIWKTIRPPINPETGKRPPSTFFIWLSGTISIYILIFGVASQRYENKLDIIENRANSIFSQLSIKEKRKDILSRITQIQNMKCPHKPQIFNPITVLKSLFFKEKPKSYHSIVELMKDTLVIWKESLDGVDIKYANLAGADLSYANLSSAELSYSNLTKTNLSFANLSKAELYSVDLSQTRIENVNFKDARGLPEWVRQGLDINGIYTQKTLLVSIKNGFKNLERSNLMFANFESFNLENVNFEYSNLREGIFKGAVLKEANLANTTLRCANFCNANLVKANLQYADLTGAKFLNANCSHSNLQCSNLFNTFFGFTNLYCANFGYAENLPEWIKAGLKEGIYSQDQLVKSIENGFNNLEGSSIISANLSNITINEANFTLSKLKEVDFSNSVLKEINFEYTDISTCNFEGTKFKSPKFLPKWIEKGLSKNGIFSQSILIDNIKNGINDLKGANLMGVNLSHVDLTSSNLEGANLKDANLSHTKLKFAHIFSANLEGANLTNANLKSTQILSANFKDAKGIPDLIKIGIDKNGVYTGIKIVESIKKGLKNLEGAYLSYLNLSNVDLSYANLKNANLTRANLKISDLSYANLKNANLTRANLEISDLSHANLENTILLRANLKDAMLYNANLKGANLTEANLKNTFCLFETTNSVDGAIFYNVKFLPKWIKKGLNNKGVYKNKQ